MSDISTGGTFRAMRAIAGLVLLVLTAGAARADENAKTEAWLRRMEMQRQTDALQRQADALERMNARSPQTAEPAPALASGQWIVVWSSPRNALHRLMVDATSIRVLGSSRLIRWTLRAEAGPPTVGEVSVAVMDCAKSIMEPMWPANTIISISSEPATKALFTRSCAVKPVITASSR